MKRDESGKDDHEGKLDREIPEKENQKISVGGKGADCHSFELEHKGEWPHSHESGPKHK